MNTDFPTSQGKLVHHIITIGDFDIGEMFWTPAPTLWRTGVF